MLIDMLIFRLALLQRSCDQSTLFEARPRDFVRIDLPTTGASTPSNPQGARRL